MMTAERRLVDADAILRKICGDSCGCEPDECGYIDEYRHERCKAGQYMANAPTVNEWTSVKDRLPEAYKAVLGYAPDNKNIWAVTMHDDGNWYMWCPALVKRYDPDWNGQITHWRPMPEPPKEDDDALN